MEETTTIAVKKSTWTILNAHRQCGESMDDVILRFIGKKKEVANEATK
jgi:hypothetical protein